MPNGLLILFTFALYGLCVYGLDLARLIGRKRKIIGKPYKGPPIHYNCRCSLDNCETLREVNARRGKG